MNGGVPMREKPTITIFGGTGNLTFRKLLPALYNRMVSGLALEGQNIIIIGRRDYTDETYRERAREWVRKFARLPYRDETFDAFAENIHYFKMDFTDPATYPLLDAYLDELGIGSCVFYFAVAPRFFGTIADGLFQIGHAQGSKVILEKPFGETLEDARALNERLESAFTPQNIYRIDHYLGKEMVRNVQTIRFANPIFADAWDARHIACIQISAMEDVGVETRGGYYDHSGVMRDMVQNHLFQILSILAMERPAEFTPEALHTEQLKVLRALRAPEPEHIADTMVLGQYAGYREESNVSAQSKTPTYAALKLFVDNPRWKDMPFYIRTGKKLGRREMEVAIVFRSPQADIPPAVLLVKFQPTEGVYLQFNIKRPGEFEDIVPAKMDFCQSCSITNRINTPEAYERLLNACFHDERAWFSQWDQIETSWKFVDALEDAYGDRQPDTYTPDTEGPAEAAALLAQAGHSWFSEPELH